MSCAVLSAGALTTVGAALAAVPTHRPATHSSARTSTARAAATMTVYWRGNGHGHGLSQYGAQGAALQGLSTQQILAFYYPGTTLTTVAPSTIRVKLSNTATTYTTVLAGASHLTLSGYGALPASGYSRFRLVPSGSGLVLEGRRPARWRVLKTALPSRADFSSSAGWVQVLNYDGSSNRYRGTVGAVRYGAGELTVNRLALDLYVQGSVPREVPISWKPAAVHAQAIAARSYAEAERAGSGAGSLYDICDTTACQAYGGMGHYDSAGNLQWTDAPQALTGNKNTVLHYRGQPVLAQYAASNGGASTYGGRPYLVGRSDPYDGVASGDPYLNQSTTVSTASIASSVGLVSLTTISGIKRDGNGPWGGRIVSANVIGTTSAGATRSVAVDGLELGYAMGVGTDYLLFAVPASAPSAPTSVRARSGDAGARISWAAPADPGSTAITGYRVRVGSLRAVLPAGARSVWMGPLSNWTASSVRVRAMNSSGYGAVATITAKGRATADKLVALAPARLFDTRLSAAPVTPAHPLRVTIAGRGGVPKSGATAVQLSLTMVRPTASGVLRIAPVGVTAPALAAIAYVAGRSTTATVTVPLTPSATIQFTPSAGSLEIAGDQQSYSAASGAGLRSVRRQTVAVVNDVAKSGTMLDLSGLRGITGTTTGVVLAIDAHGSRPTSLVVWPDGTPMPQVRHVTVSPYSSATNTIVVPLGATHRLRLAARNHGAVARVQLIGVLGPSNRGGLVTFPASAIADGAGARTVGTTPVAVPVSGVGQVAASGVQAVLVHLTVRSASSAAGLLWAYPAGTPTPAAPVVRFGPHGVATATALLRLSAGGALDLRSSVPGLRVSVDAIGYATAG